MFWRGELSQRLRDRSSYVDVRDLALAHARALTTPEAGGERIIVSASVYKWQDWGKAGLRVRAAARST